VAPDPNILRSLIPGVVESVAVKAGQRVKKGEKLMTYEAMKMKNIISAPFDGKIKSVEVKEGDKLPKGATLIVME
jgi:pyruvate carboxylase